MKTPQWVESIKIHPFFKKKKETKFGEFNSGNSLNELHCVSRQREVIQLLREVTLCK